MPNNVLMCRHPRPDASIRLICFPWAGGGSLFYTNWAKWLPPSIEVHGICLGGRESRFKDPPYWKLGNLIDDVTEAIYNTCREKPFAIWGHSLGGLCTYETVVALKSRYNLEPVHIFVSGISAPHAEQRKKSPKISTMTDKEFIDFLKLLGGTPTEILENKDAMEYFMPPLRADYELLEQFSYEHPRDRCVMSCPVDVFDGMADVKHDLEAWRKITTGPFSITKMNGGHFYLKEEANLAKLCETISKSLL